MRLVLLVLFAGCAGPQVIATETETPGVYRVTAERTGVWDQGRDRAYVALYRKAKTLCAREGFATFEVKGLGEKGVFVSEPVRSWGELVGQLLFPRKTWTADARVRCLPLADAP